MIWQDRFLDISFIFDIIYVFERVAQLDRALGYGPRGWGFKSSHAREKVTSMVAF